MRDLAKRPLEQFFASVADDLAILLVDAEEAAVGALVGDADGGVLEGAAEPLLVLAQGLFGPLALGDLALELAGLRMARACGAIGTRAMTVLTDAMAVASLIRPASR